MALKSLLLLVALLIVQCTSRRERVTPISYPHPLPDSVALTFLPGIVSRDSLDFNAAFSPDGERFYFSRSVNGKWMIYMTALHDSVWSKPTLAPFTETEYSQADPFFTHDGTLYYISNRPRDPLDTIPDYDIWFVRPQPDGSWSAPENPKNINSDSTEYYVSLAANGNIYFASNRVGTMGSHDIYMSRYVNGAYTAPENLGAGVNSNQMEHDPMISPDEQALIFTSVDRSDSYGSGDLYYSLRDANGAWSSAKNMGSKFNTDSYEYCSYLTPDARYLFYSTNYDVKWIDTRYLPWLADSTAEQ
jgi:Tol biopolymer transport system component